MDSSPVGTATHDGMHDGFSPVGVADDTIHVFGCTSQAFRGVDLFRSNVCLHALVPSAPLPSLTGRPTPPSTPSPGRPRQRDPEEFVIHENSSDDQEETVLAKFIEHTNRSFADLGTELTRVFDGVSTSRRELENDFNIQHARMRDQMTHRFMLSNAEINRLDARMDFVLETINAVKDIVIEKTSEPPAVTFDLARDSQAAAPPAAPMPALPPPIGPHMAEARSLRHLDLAVVVLDDLLIAEVVRVDDLLHVHIVLHDLLNDVLKTVPKLDHRTLHVLDLATVPVDDLRMVLDRVVGLVRPRHLMLRFDVKHIHPGNNISQFISCFFRWSCWSWGPVSCSRTWTLGRRRRGVR